MDWTNQRRALRRQQAKSNPRYEVAEEPPGYLVSVGDTIEWCSTRKEAVATGRLLASLLGVPVGDVVVEAM